jgi:5-bromo-4-chloroindolyl phosphate hydrolysis protein
MSRLRWIIKEMYKDSRKNIKWILKGVGLTMVVIFLIKILIYFGLKDIFLPLMVILIPIGMLYHWYSMSYDNEQTKIIEKLKDSE